MPRLYKSIISVFICLSLAFLSFTQNVSAYTSDLFPLVILSQYDATLDIGDELYILAITSNGKKASWKSSNSKVASVNTYGIITAKKAGTAVITAKITKAEASCRITVNKTSISINKSSVSLEHGESIKLTAVTSNGSDVVWKCSKTSIASIDEYGKVTGKKPGETIVTASADGSSATCPVIVKAPSVELDRSSLSLYRGQTATLSADVSSGIKPTWKTNRKSVAIVDSNGTVTAIKNGKALITATVDGVSKTCEITVRKPDIELSSTELTVKKGEKAAITAFVSSNNKPAWSTSNTNILTINNEGEITAKKKGRAYVYASEDGTKVRCTVYVTE
jgi:uncharacterized protein YjdB